MFLLTIMEFNLPFLVVEEASQAFSCQCYAGFAGSVCVTRQIRCKDQGGL